MLFSAIFFTVLALAGLGTASSGCARQLLEDANGVKQMEVNGTRREYALHVPYNYDPERAYRLVFGYHWFGGTMHDVSENKFYGLAESSISNRTAIFVAPQGFNNAWLNDKGSDVKFTDAILAELMNQFCINDMEIFATGFSFGGSMSYALACSRPDVFRGVAVNAGEKLSGCDGGNKPVPYLGIHGVEDSVLEIESGRAMRNKFIKLNGCKNKEAREPKAGSKKRIRTEYKCDAAYPVWWIAHGGDHAENSTDVRGPGIAKDTWDFFDLASSRHQAHQPNPQPPERLFRH